MISNGTGKTDVTLGPGHQILSVIGKVSSSFKSRYFLVTAFILSIVCIFTYVVEPIILGSVFQDRAWHSISVLVRSLILFVVVIIITWKSGIKTGLFVSLLIGLLFVPHVFFEMAGEEFNYGYALEYILFLPLGVLIAWLTTNRLKVEKKLKESEEQFRVLAEKSPNMIFINQAGRLAYVNDKCSEIMGYDKEEFLSPGFDFFCLIAPEDIDRVNANYARHGVGEEIPPCDYSIIGKDGRRIDVSLATKLIDFRGSKAILGVITDITDRKKFEQQLMLQAEILDSIPDMVFLHDFDGNILYANKSAYLITGYSREELVKMNLSQLSSQETMENTPGILKEIMEKGQASFEVKRNSLDGTEIPMEVHASKVTLDNKALVVAVSHDIQNRKSMQEQLVTADRLASIGQLVSGIAHEINNPLTSILGFASLLMNRDLPADVREDLTIIQRESERASRIVKNLLTFARQNKKEKEMLDVSECVKTCLNIRKYELSVNNIQVIEDFSPNLPKIMGNDSQLQQVFFNIIINAEQAMAEARQKGRLTISTKKKDDSIIVSFEDDGPGISAEHVSRLFSPFFTTKDIGKGTGLGLSICQGIVVEHGGRIRAESTPGKGATFIIELPSSVL